MRTRASHGTGKGRRSVLPVRRFVLSGPVPVLSATLSGLSVIVLALAFLGCGDSAQGDRDATLPGDGGITDAYVDEGTLDCGTSPWDGAICLKGTLHDLATEEPIGVSAEGRIVSFSLGHSGSNVIRDNPEVLRGRIARSGRFVTWTNWEYDSCLMLLDSFEGYSRAHATTNCYAFRFPRRPEEPLRVYIPSDAVLEGWDETYPGELSVATAWPLTVGVCRDSLWQPMDGGRWLLTWYDMYQQAEPEQYALSGDRLRIIPPRHYWGGDMPASGAMVALVNLDDDMGMSSLSLSCTTTDEFSDFATTGLGGRTVSAEQIEILVLSGFKNEE